MLKGIIQLSMKKKFKAQSKDQWNLTGMTSLTWRKGMESSKYTGNLKDESRRQNM